MATETLDIETALSVAARSIAEHNNAARLTARQAAMATFDGDNGPDNVRELVQRIRGHVASLDAVNGPALKRALDTLALCDRILAHVDTWNDCTILSDANTYDYSRDAARLDVQTSLMALAQLAPKTVRGNADATDILRALLNIASSMRHVAVKLLPTSLPADTIKEVQSRIADAEQKAAVRRARLTGAIQAAHIAIETAQA